MSWVKGQSGNLKGRPPRAVEAHALRKLKPLEPDILAAFKSLLTDADGRVRAKGVELGFAYLYGKPTDAVAPPAAGQVLTWTPDELEAAEAQLEPPAIEGEAGTAEPAAVPTTPSDRDAPP